MTPKERILKALSHEETEIVPYQLSITAEAREKLINYYGDNRFENWIVNHMAGTGPNLPKEYLKEKQYRDVWGCVWEEGNILHLVETPLKEPSLSGYQFPNFSRPEYYQHIPEFIQAWKDRFTFFNLGLFFFERSWALRGFENILMDLMLEPSFVEALLDRLVEIQLDIIDRVKQYPFDAIGFGDDFGQQRGLIMGPSFWRRYFKPRLKILYQRAHQLGFFVRIHSCGDNSEIMEDLIEIGVDIFNPFQPEAMDVYQLKKEFGHRIVFEGGISTQRTLPFGSPDEVRFQAQDCLKTLGAGGGYIAGPSKPIMPEVPAENAATLIETLVFQRHYSGEKDG
ncbi:MAG: hypothetical protein NC911_05055 [Candidatus Omnitrophica bacterium]|nr:hypothetical protein [Candidatus Omnitrophota bacterium]MCM8769030.1 hypothetical protein [Candidatus Omnitrophota bacterium]